jgi:2-polyprenyl-6-hydroxyphenyl methylase / 3-demethylubiquinone-9 3-methyltransferase
MSQINNQIYDDKNLDWWGRDDFMAILRNSVNPPRSDYFSHVLTKKLKLDPKRLRVLDVGCGGGLLAEEFARLGCLVTGADPSASALDCARQHAVATRLPIEYVHAAGENLPFSASSFDVVCCCDVLEHVDDVTLILQQISRVLKPGGVFFYDTINRTLMSKLVAIKLAQDWTLTRFIPRDVHVWEKFIRPEELVTHMQACALQHAGSVGLSAMCNPVRALLALAKKRMGQISYAQLGDQLKLKASSNHSIAYMGFAIRLINI